MVSGKMSPENCSPPPPPRKVIPGKLPPTPPKKNKIKKEKLPLTQNVKEREEMMRTLIKTKSLHTPRKNASQKTTLGKNRRKQL